MTDRNEISLAETAAEKAQNEVIDAIRRRQHFKLEAGAGAGKTYTLLNTLRYLLQEHEEQLKRNRQKIACITFTNVAKAQIQKETDHNPVVACDTIHGFCWNLISSFQDPLRRAVPKLTRWTRSPWTERLEEAAGVGGRAIHYTLGHRGITDSEISIHHDDVIELTVELFKEAKFRLLFKHRYPVVFIDEYQDTDEVLMSSLVEHFLEEDAPPLLGLFGDHWQKIYDHKCGTVNHPNLLPIGKQANFRSTANIVDALNKMRPELEQFVVDPTAVGDIKIFDTNNWKGERLTGNHYGGDLPENAAGSALSTVEKALESSGWKMDAETTKILMLTHKALGKKLGYSGIVETFTFNDSFKSKEDPYIEFFVDHLEPACRAFETRNYGSMFAFLGYSSPPIRSIADKRSWSRAMEKLIQVRLRGTIADVLEFVESSKTLRAPERLSILDAEVRSFTPNETSTIPRQIEESQMLRGLPYSEVISLSEYLDGQYPFETKHGVKGDQFENVLIVVGRGWNKYNFEKMLVNANRVGSLNAKEMASYERNRNLFYVACSRPRKRLAILFTQKLSSSALETIDYWFGQENRISLFE